MAAVGNEDGAHKVIADCFQALNDIGFTIPVPDAIASATSAAARNAAHLASALRDGQYPPYN